MFDSLVGLMQDFINWLYYLTVNLGIPSYFLAIIIFTILAKILLYPLTAKQMKSMKAMQEIQPKIKEIQAKQKDPQKSQAEMMAVYQEHGVNPLAGCLPILIQMPIFFALFSALKQFPYASQAHASMWWFGTTLNLSKPDPYYILPILAGLSTFVQQKLSSTNVDDPMQKNMLYMMPIMFIFFAAKVHAGLALYWVAFNVLGAIQQYFINKQHVTLKEVSTQNESGRKNR